MKRQYDQSSILQAAHRLARFRGDERGVIAMLFAIVAVPVLLTIGLSIDYGHATAFQSSIQKVLDEAVLDGARALARTGEAGEASAAAKRRFDATKPKEYEIALQLSANAVKGTVTADASAAVPMRFMGLAGFNTLTVTAKSVASGKPARKSGSKQARAASSALRQAMGSMSDRGIRDLVYRVNEMCYKLRQMNFAHRVPQCRAVFDGTFEKQLRTQLASNGDAKSLLPAGVRLVQ